MPRKISRHGGNRGDFSLVAVGQVAGVMEQRSAPQTGHYMVATPCLGQAQPCNLLEDDHKVAALAFSQWPDPSEGTG